MKRWSLVLISALLGAGMPAAGQAQGLTFGATVGLNRANISSDEISEGAESKYGLLIGGFVNVPASDRLAIRPELLFTQKGVNFQEGDDEGALKFSYIEVPILARLALGAPGARGVMPVLFAGPAIGFQLDAEIESTDDDAGDASEVYKSTDFGVVLGGGIEVSGFSADLRYDIGLTQLADAVDFAELSNRVLSLTFGYAFPIGR